MCLSEWEKIREEGSKESEQQNHGAVEVHLKGRICREMCKESVRDDGKAKAGDVQGRCGLKEEREGDARRINEERQKPGAAERAEVFHLYQP